MFIEIEGMIYNSDNIIMVKLDYDRVIIRLSDGSDTSITPTNSNDAKLVARDIYVQLSELLDSQVIKIESPRIWKTYREKED